MVNDIGLRGVNEVTRDKIVLWRSEAMASKSRDRPHTLDPPQLYLPDMKHEDFFIGTKFLSMLYHPELDWSHRSQRGTISYSDPRGIDGV